MDALTALTSRVSVPKLTAPAPEGDALDRIIEAGLHAPDHGRLRPWRFLLIEGEGLERFCEVFVEALLKQVPNPDEALVEKARSRPKRAPLIIAVIAKVTEGKIPAVEQVVSAGAAAQNMLLAAHAQGFGGMWRTGPAAYDAHIRSALGAEGEDVIVGYLYLGTPDQPVRVKKTPAREGIVENWG